MQTSEYTEIFGIDRSRGTLLELSRDGTMLSTYETSDYAIKIVNVE